MKRALPRGNRWSRRCYNAALHAMWAAAEAGRDPELVHGFYTPCRHEHAWCEVGGDVIDLTQGEAPVPRVDYYAANQIDPAEVRRYSPREASALLLVTNSCGPWPEAAAEAVPLWAQGNR